MRFVFLMMFLFINFDVMAEDIKIAIIGDYSGTIKGYEVSKEYVETWYKQNRTIEGKNVIIKYFDDKCNEKTAVEEFEFIQKWKPNVIIGPTCSGPTIAVEPIFTKLNIPVMCPTPTNTLITNRGWTNFFRVYDNEQVKMFVESRKFEKYKRIALVSDGSFYGDTLNQEVASVLKEKVYFSGTITDSSHATLLNNIAAVGADVIFYGGYGKMFTVLSEGLLDRDIVLYHNNPDVKQHNTKTVSYKIKFNNEEELKKLFNTDTLYTSGVFAYASLEVFKTAYLNSTNHLEYIKNNSFSTVIGNIKFLPNGDLITKNITDLVQE